MEFGGNAYRRGHEKRWFGFLVYRVVVRIFPSRFTFKPTGKMKLGKTVTVLLLQLVISIAFWIAVIWVAAHFIRKFW